MASATLWQLALQAADGFAVIGDGRSVPKVEILRHAADLAALLAMGGESGRRTLGVVATASPVATVVTVLALSSLATPAAMVGSLSSPGSVEVLRGLSPAFVVHDARSRSSIASVGVEIQLDSGTGAVTGMSSKGRRRGLTPICMADDGDPMHWPFLAFRTSGTSLAPRWVVHSEASLWASLESKVRGMARYQRDQGLCAANRETVGRVVGAPRAVFIPLATISGYTQFVHCLALGVPLVSTAKFLPRQALRLTSRVGAGTLVVTPSMMRLMTTLPEARTLNWDLLRVVGLGGGHLQPELWAATEEAFGALVIQGYGSTEMGGAVTNVRIYDDPWVRGHTVGRALGGVEVEVHGPNGSKVNLGDAGEIMVRGPARMALGYLTTRTGAMEHLELRGGFLPTGDIGRMGSDRNLVVLGRMAGRISRGDETFFPEEVEAVLETHPRVLRAHVTSEDREGALVLRATCECNDGSKIRSPEIRAWCSERLSRARCPDVVDFAIVPRTETGKTMRRPETRGR